MNSKGIFCIAIVLVFICSILLFESAQSETSLKISKTITLAIENEKNNVERAFLEENTDKIIARALQAEIQFGNLDPEKVKVDVCSQIFNFFRQKQKFDEPFRKIEFFSTTFSSRQYNGIIFSNSKQPLQFQDLVENSKVLIVPLGKNSFAAEFYFTGGLYRNKLVGAEISSKNSMQVFLLPIDYTARVLVLK